MWRRPYIRSVRKCVKVVLSRIKTNLHIKIPRFLVHPQKGHSKWVLISITNEKCSYNNKTISYLRLLFTLLNVTDNLVVLRKLNQKAERNPKFTIVGQNIYPLLKTLGIRVKNSSLLKSNLIWKEWEKKCQKKCREKNVIFS